MSFDIEQSMPYKKLSEKLETSTTENTVVDLENLRIESVLVKVNSTSHKFQIRSLVGFCVYFFFMGIHTYTFLFMYISPKFFVTNKHGQGSPPAL